MRIEINLTKREAEALLRPTEPGFAEHTRGIDWPHGAFKSAARLSAERKLIAALRSQVAGQDG